MKLLTVVGARPQFIKAAVGSRVFRKKHTEILVHTGQHYDANMSDIFFEEMDIPHPDYNLGISGGSHGKMTGEMLTAIEEILLKEQPDMMLVYGDTNSTLAAALAAVKLHIPVAHVESGNRFGTLDSPEEVNRICTDHVSAIRFACTQSALDSLVKENLGTNSYCVGDPMYDAFLYYREKAEKLTFEMKGLDGSRISVPKRFYYMTCHRQENTGDPQILAEILSAMDALDASTVYPVHPRNHKTVQMLMDKHHYKQLLFVEPVGYLESIYLVSNAEKVVTDSGGLQREAFFAEKKCVTVLDFVVWPETMIGNRNQLAKPLKGDILAKLATPQEISCKDAPFGDGDSAQHICRYLEEFQKERV
ncbi:MAG: UDP-N-acetylglucosamine 2-epimerase (non-hydrolyzing) [Ruminococcaceae bacterium]|nr:UDP-N-acetylglucosamine 2-epimerase (non-hydrolyzing) [Oscillospiraceae bacterium]